MFNETPAQAANPANQTTRIIAVRHGQTDWNFERRLQGHIDIPLNAAGQWQAHQLALALAEEPIAAIYSSDLQRALETAAPLGSSTGIQAIADPALRERNFGIFEGKTFGEIEVSWTAEARRWRQREPDFAPHGGESLVQLHQRVDAVVGTLAARHTGSLVLLVTHGGVLDALYRLASRLDAQAPGSWGLENAAINRLLWTPQGLTLVGWSDCRHLDDMPASIPAAPSVARAHTFCA